MNRFKRILSGAILIVAVGGVSAAAQNVRTDYDHDVRFDQFHTFCISHVHTANPLAQQRLQDAITRNLTAKGWQPASSGGCDVSVNAVGYVKDRTEYTTFYNGFGGGWGWRGRGWGAWGGGPAITNVDQIPVGLLVVDLYDAHSFAILWRGTSNQDLSDKPEKNAQKLNKAVDKMFKNFPPKS
jgi:hypothetical protein